jgi:vacuolar-type H+-ATPase subunit E/Vma4
MNMNNKKQRVRQVLEDGQRQLDCEL